MGRDDRTERQDAPALHPYVYHELPSERECAESCLTRERTERQRDDRTLARLGAYAGRWGLLWSGRAGGKRNDR